MHVVLMARIAKIGLTGSVLSLSMLVAGCATDSLDLAPASYTEPWTADANTPIRSGNFSVPPNPLVAELAAPPSIKSEHTYSLPELIDIAQSQNPDTRIAWQQARQAALAVGMGEAIFLPIISASVIGGYHRTTTLWGRGSGPGGRLVRVCPCAAGRLGFLPARDAGTGR